MFIMRKYTPAVWTAAAVGSCADCEDSWAWGDSGEGSADHDNTSQ